MIAFTKRFQARIQHHLVSLNEGRHGHSCAIDISLTRSFLPEDIHTIQRLVIEPLDGQVLSGLFAIPTGEQIVEWVFSTMESEFGQDLVSVVLQETEKNKFLSSRNRLFLS